MKQRIAPLRDALVFTIFAASNIAADGARSAGSAISSGLSRLLRSPFPRAGREVIWRELCP